MAKKPHRRIVEKSHQRSQEFGIQADDVFAKRFVDGTELQALFSENNSLMDTASVFIKDLFESLQGTGFIIILTDSEGCILHLKGDKEIIEEAHKLNMVQGAYMSEESIGTNAMGTALKEDEPVQITAEEHFISAYHRWTCSAAPIHYNGEIIGCLNLTGNKKDVHPHTLSLVRASVKAIEHKMENNHMARKLYDAQQYAFSMMNHLSYGVFAINLYDDIQWVNDTACRILNIRRKNLVKTPIQELLPDWRRIKRILLHDLAFEDEASYFEKEDLHQQFHFNAYTIKTETREILGFLLTFRSFQRTMNMLNKVKGMQASYSFSDIIGKTKKIQETIDYAKKISKSEATILISGESGTGKEIFVQSIHNESVRKDRPFIAVNCGAISPTLIESELFGYEEGAFTGARKGGKPGKFEIANGGTLFLDEIGEMPLDMQVKLLRAVQEKKITRVGGDKEIATDVRIISATNKNLQEEVNKGKFREDLYYRLNVFSFEIPPLRERKEDIPPLAKHFSMIKANELQKPVPEIPREKLHEMVNYRWPGNVRELENYIEKFVILGGKAPIQNTFSESEPEEERSEIITETGYSVKPLHEIEKEALIKTLSEYNGNVSQTSRALRIGRNTLYDKLRKYKINLTHFK